MKERMFYRIKTEEAARALKHDGVRGFKVGDFIDTYMDGEVDDLIDESSGVCFGYLLMMDALVWEKPQWFSTYASYKHDTGCECNVQKIPLRVQGDTEHIVEAMGMAIRDCMDMDRHFDAWGIELGLPDSIDGRGLVYCNPLWYDKDENEARMFGSKKERR